MSSPTTLADLPAPDPDLARVLISLLARTCPAQAVVADAA